MDKSILDEAFGIIGKINDMDDLRTLYKFIISKIKAQRDVQTRIDALNYHIGQAVTFGKKNGIKRSGKVVKLNPKRMVVAVENEGEWNVPYSLVSSS